MPGQGPCMQWLCQQRDQIEITVTERNIAEWETCFIFFYLFWTSLSCTKPWWINGFIPTENSWEERSEISTMQRGGQNWDPIEWIGKEHWFPQPQVCKQWTPLPRPITSQHCCCCGFSGEEPCRMGKLLLYPFRAFLSCTKTHWISESFPTKSSWAGIPEICAVRVLLGSAKDKWIQEQVL